MVRLGWFLERFTNPERAKRRKWVLEGIDSFVKSLDEAKNDKVLTNLVRAEAIWEIDRLIGKSDYNIQDRLHQITEIAEKKIKQKRAEEKKLKSLLEPRQNTLPVTMEKPEKQEEAQVSRKALEKQQGTAVKNQEPEQPAATEKAFLGKKILHEEPELKKFRDYLHSRTWQEKRNKKIEAANFSCERCGSASAKDSFHVCHKSFANLYKESLDDLEVVCENCKKEESYLKSLKK